MCDIDAQLAEGAGAKDIDPYARGFLGFSRADLSIIRLVAQGFDKSEIRIRMEFSAQQTRDHFRQIFRRTGLRDLHQIARWAVENGLDELVEDGEFNGQEPDDRLERLSPRENQVLAKLVEGVRYKEMARRLELSPKTIDTHRRALMRKLDVQHIAGLVKASREGETR